MRGQIKKACSIPPRQHVIIYFTNKKMPEQIAEKFYEYYEALGWKSSKNNTVNWKKEATNWIWKEQERIKKLRKIFTSNQPIQPYKK